MKLLVITSLKEYQETVAKIVDQAKISVYSVSETIGFKDHQAPNLLDIWFSRSGGEQFDSIFLFSFTEEAKAILVLDLIKNYNNENQSGFPVRAFIMPVEKSSYDNQ